MASPSEAYERDEYTERMVSIAGWACFATKPICEADNTLLADTPINAHFPPPRPRAFRADIDAPQLQFRKKRIPMLAVILSPTKPAIRVSQIDAATHSAPSLTRPTNTTGRHARTPTGS